MNTQDVIRLASEYLRDLNGHTFDIFTISKPSTLNAALNLAKVTSKLSPLIGNLIEFNTIEVLNGKKEFKQHGQWKRQDPGFPDAIFDGKIRPTPGLEIKAWFPLATEITARFKDSQNHFEQDQTYVAMLAWLPDHLIYGRPMILDLLVVSGLSVAWARDDHYHNPPDYLVLEPEDTANRTANLQQTNTNGYKFQGTKEEFKEAQKVVASWGPNGTKYQPTREYQHLLRKLIEKFKFRLDTNFAKMDRIVHKEIEEFKNRVYNQKLSGMSIRQWNRLLSSKNEAEIKKALQYHVGITSKSPVI